MKLSGTGQEIGEPPLISFVFGPKRPYIQGGSFVCACAGRDGPVRVYILVCVGASLDVFGMITDQLHSALAGQRTAVSSEWL